MPAPPFRTLTALTLCLLATACGGGSGGWVGMADPGRQGPRQGAPPKEPAITAPAVLTAGQGGYHASVPALKGASFTWTLSNGTLTAGGNGPEITFKAGEAGALTLTCAQTTRRGTTAGTLSIPVRTGPILTGPRISVLRQGIDTVSTPAVPGATYAWTASGATLLKGQGTPTITLFNGGSGAASARRVQALGAADDRILVTLARTDPATGDVTSSQLELREVAEDDLAPAGLAFTAARVVLTLGEPMDELVQDSEGGSIQAYAIAPALPAGLALDPATGFISGTPAVLSPETDYTLTATNAVGTATAPLTLAVIDRPPSGLAYGAPTAVFTRGTAIPPDIPASSGGAATAFAVTPPLPPGLALDPVTGVIAGTPATASPTTSYTVTATNTGGSASTVLTFTVVDATRPTLAYPGGTMTCTRGVAATPAIPVATDAAGATYRVTPPLPAGLTMDPATGIIGGTPAALSPATVHLVTLDAPNGSAQATLTLTIIDLPPANLAYPGGASVFTRGVAIPGATPAWSGGAPVTFAISPALPAGLTLDPATGALAGTPAVLSPAATYTVTATNTGGSAQAQIVLTVNDAAPSGLAYANASATYIRNHPIAPDTPTSAGGAVVAYTVFPALPAGLTLDPVSGVLAGTPTAVAALATYTVTATNSGGSATAELSFRVEAEGPVITRGPDSLTLFEGRRAAFTVAATGAAPLVYQWTKNGVAIPGATGTSYLAPPAVPGDEGARFAAVVTDALGDSSTSPEAVLSVTRLHPRFALVASGSERALTSYAVDAVSGQLRFRDWAATGLEPSSVAVDLQGRVAFVANQGDGTLSSFGLGTDGSLTALATTPTGVEPRALALDAGGSFLYVLCAEPANPGGTLEAFSIGNDGSLLSQGTVATGKAPSGIALESSGRFAYVANLPEGTVSAFAIGSGGSLLPVSGSPFPVGTSPACVAADPSGAYLLVADIGDQALKAFGIDPSSGALALAGSLPVTLGLIPSLAFDPAGGSVYLAAAGDPSLPGAVRTFAFASGTLSETGGATSVGMRPEGILVDPSGAFVLVANAGDGSISAFARDASGALTPAATNLAGRASGSGSLIRGRGHGRALAVAAGAAAASWIPGFVYVADPTSGSIAGYGLDGSTGSLAAVSGMPVDAAPKPRGIAVDPTGATAFVTHFVPTAEVDPFSSFSIHDGAFTPLASSLAPLGKPVSFVLEPGGRFAVSSDKATTDLQVHRVSGGGLAPAGSATAPGTAAILAFAPAGRFFFAATSGSVAAFVLDASGNVTRPSSGDAQPAGLNPRAICVDPSGRYLFVGNSGLGFGGDAVWSYAIDPSTGGLTPLGTRALSPGNDGITSLAMDPLGRFLFAAVYNLGPPVPIHRLGLGADGSLTDLGTTPADPALDPGVKLLAVDPSGRFLLMTNGLTPELTVFSIDPSTGVLTPIGQAIPAPGSPLDTSPPAPMALAVTGTVR